MGYMSRIERSNRKGSTEQKTLFFTLRTAALVYPQEKGPDGAQEEEVPVAEPEPVDEKVDS